MFDLVVNWVPLQWLMEPAEAVVDPPDRTQRLADFTARQ